VRCKAEAWVEYLKRFPLIQERRIYLAMDEWSAPAGPGVRTNISTAWVFHEMFRHTDFVKMSAHTMGYSCITYNRTESQLNSQGLIFKFYRDHYGTIPVSVTGNSPQPPPKWPVGGDQPKVNAGSDTYPLDVVAAWTADHKLLTVAILNPDESAHDLTWSFKGVEFTGKGRMWRMTSPDARATDGIGKKPAVDIAETALANLPKSVPVPPLSIDLFEFTVR
jgi:alpha-L-arabinofuranosidase